ncbi:hypothetical protein [Pseudobacteriovorax antillogorgiicola]|uniref:Uncharacterized protein n=1 Tax=Pseudobacteriovorax antillogorgiicola TaxID=1513793 RepID=A0A1Y6BKH6_9BACT|nr:hypothetical protein [Pseudobacteriovorax antillogorgiicola]TCS56229.1 hypothetical protein EDD56_10451 [Pseudobacteriovorax antillogorgiicola]SMF08273.1 hypothetical protein SAMN06296036_104282 [Pseudobacteriovorax antillogorgiicola]
MIRTLTLGSLFVASSLLAAGGPIREQAPITKFFIPNGFDNNDNTEVVIHGKLPSTCYHTGDAKAKVNSKDKSIQVDADVLFYPDTYCIQSITPYIQTVKTGVLEKGEYKVSFGDDPTVTETFAVKERTTESPDDFLYAPVANAFIDVDYDTGKQALKLQGTFPHLFIGCMIMKEVRVFNDPADVMVVQPITEIVDDARCDEQPADRSYQVTKGLAQPFFGEGLLHVRVLDGNSLNRFLDIPAM